MAIKITVRRSNDRHSAEPLRQELYVGGPFHIGSERGSHLYLNGAGVSPRQAVLFDNDGRTMLLSAAGGNELNGRPLPEQSERPLGDGDLLRFAGYLVSFSSEDARAAEPRAGGALPRTQPHELRQHLAEMYREEEPSYKYYFLVRGGARDGERIILEGSNGLGLGWDETWQAMCLNPPPDGLRAVVEFRLPSEFFIRPAHPSMVAVNDRLISEPRPLADGDEVRLAATPLTATENMAALVFHQPALTDVFARAFKRRELAGAVEAEARAEESEPVTEESESATADEGGQKAQPAPPKIYLGYFTGNHVLLFLTVWAIFAALTFLLLKLFS